jgi:hypothetical protein
LCGSGYPNNESSTISLTALIWPRFLNDSDRTGGLKLFNGLARVLVEVGELETGIEFLSHVEAACCPSVPPCPAFAPPH